MSASDMGVDLEGLERTPSWAQNGHPVRAQGGHIRWNPGAKEGQVRPALSRGNVDCGLQQGQHPLTQHPHTTPPLGPKAGDTPKVTLKGRLTILKDHPDVTLNSANGGCR